MQLNHAQFNHLRARSSAGATTRLLIETEAAWKIAHKRWEAAFVRQVNDGQRRAFFLSIFDRLGESLNDRAHVVSAAILLLSGASLGWPKDALRQALETILRQNADSRPVIEWLEWCVGESCAEARAH